MSCERLSLLTNVTRPPRVTVTVVGLTEPVALIVIVAESVGVVVVGGVVAGGVVVGGVEVVGGVVGAVGVDGAELLPPQAAAVAAATSAIPNPFQIVRLIRSCS